MMESAPCVAKLGGQKLIHGQGQEIIFSVYSFMKMEPGQEIGEKPYKTDTSPSEGLYCS
jgi:hypothetical protein